MQAELKVFPEAFRERLKQIVPPGLLSEVGKGYLATRPTTFRINTLKDSPQEVLRDLKKCGLDIEAVSGLPAYTLKKGSFKKLSESSSYEEGKIYLQSLSSQIPPLLLAPQSGETILDMAAAPGGKTCQMAVLMNNQGSILALEPDKIRFERLKYNIAKQGAAIVDARLRHAEKLGEEFHEKFDRILLDAPCSSEGTFSAHHRAGFSHWSVDFVKKISSLQKKLVAAAVRYLKPGGTLVYSTCAISPEENEEVVNFALAECGLNPLDITLKFPFLKPALPSFMGITYPKELSRCCRRIYPAPLHEGFFAAKLIKPHQRQ